MLSDGRIEKRATVKVRVRLEPVENAPNAETTTMVNVSRYGARVLTSLRWRPGEQVLLTSLSGEFRKKGRVIHCHPLTDGKFYVGLEFNASVKDWKDAPWASLA